MEKTAVIKISEVNDLYEFFKQASLVDGDVLLTKGKYAVDGKSMMGIFTINLSEPTLIHFPEDADAFCKYISKFLV